MIHTITNNNNNNTINTTDTQYFTKTINNTSDITNNITRHSHINYANNVIKHN